MSGDVLAFDLPLPIETVKPVIRPAGRLAPERVYESPLVTVYHGHAEDVLPLMPTESVDLIVTDPPYGVDWQSNRRKEQFDKIAYDGEGDRERIKDVLRECVRLVRQHRHLYVFGPADALDGQKVGRVVELVWNKQTLGSGDVTIPWGPSHERINFTVSKFRHAGETGKDSLPARMRDQSVLGYTRPTGTAVRHPSEKPVPLLQELIESSSAQGQLVLDPYAGVLSTAVAAILTGRRAVVCEVKREYVDLGIERIKRAEKARAAMLGI